MLSDWATTRAQATGMVPRTRTKNGDSDELSSGGQDAVEYTGENILTKCRKEGLIDISNRDKLNSLGLGTLPSLFHSPRPIPHVKTQEDIYADMIRESCVTKAAIAYFGGYALGLVFGLISDGGQVNEVKTTREVIKEMATKSRSTAKSFATFGLLFSGTECAIESVRGRTDHYNLLASGCVTGGLMGFRVGAKPAIIGCASVAAFTAAIEHFMSM